jgi:hypothetical protein
MSDKNYGEYGELIVETSTGLHDMTKDGWLLVEVLSEDEIVELTMGKAHVTPNDVNGYPAHKDNYTETEQSTARRLKFLLGKPRGLVQDELRANAERLNKELVAANTALRGRKKELDHVGESLEKALNNVECYKSLYKSEKTHHSELQARLNKMEEDLAKIRSALGDIRFKEIVEAADGP